MKNISFITCLIFWSFSVHALEFSSGKQQNAVIELYTSEGFSSCPPAERWVSSYKTHPDVFTRIIPMAFHVDYWNYLGWEDRFANPAFSDRQRRMKRQGLLRGVYTPGVLVSSQEWRAWRPASQPLPTLKKEVGMLSVKMDLKTDKSNVLIRFSEKGPYRVHLALLGMGLSSQVTSGENNRRTLDHDFVVLHHQVSKAGHSKGKIEHADTWQLKMPDIPDFGQTQTALAVWLSEPNTEKIIQATASMLP